jgi:hypothetical protein
VISRVRLPLAQIAPDQRQKLSRFLEKDREQLPFEVVAYLTQLLAERRARWF